jgi:hypothetical protein
LLSIYTKCSPLGSEIYDAAIEKQIWLINYFEREGKRLIRTPLFFIRNSRNKAKIQKEIIYTSSLK